MGDDRVEALVELLAEGRHRGLDGSSVTSRPLGQQRVPGLVHADELRHGVMVRMPRPAARPVGACARSEVRMSRSCRRLRSHNMTLQRMDNVLIVVEDLEAAKAFFSELGMALDAETTVEGPWVDQTVGLEGVRADIAMMRPPDGHGRVELSRFHTPRAVRSEPDPAPSNALGLRRIMFAVDDIDGTVARLRNHGAELLGEIAQYEDVYRLCFIRGPEGIIIGLAEQLG